MCVVDGEMFEHPTPSPTVSLSPTIAPTRKPTGVLIPMPTAVPSAEPSPLPSYSVFSASISLSLSGIMCSEYTRAERAVLVGSVAATVELLEEHNLGSSSCESIIRHRSLRLGAAVFEETENAAARRLSDDDLAVWINMSITLAWHEVSDDGLAVAKALASDSALLAALDTSLTNAVSSGALAAELNRANRTAMAFVSVDAVHVFQSISSSAVSMISLTFTPTVSPSDASMAFYALGMSSNDNHTSLVAMFLLLGFTCCVAISLLALLLGTCCVANISASGIWNKNQTAAIYPITASSMVNQGIDHHVMPIDRARPSFQRRLR